MQTLKETLFQFPYHFRKYQGKVRDVYIIEEEFVVLVSTDRISAFDCILPNLIPSKGQLLTLLSWFFLEQTQSIIPNYSLACPHPNVIIGYYVEPYPIEFIVRGYLCGHAWRLYQKGERIICGNKLPDGLQKNDPLPEPILTPTTKSHIGHDLDIAEEEIIRSGLIPQDEYAIIKKACFDLYRWGREKAREAGLILADTKFEFGYHRGEILLIDEIFTPDSSRYFMESEYIEAKKAGRDPIPFSKEYLREWLMKQGFQGKEGQVPPPLSEEVVKEIRQIYLTVYESLTRQRFRHVDPFPDEIENAILKTLKEWEMPTTNNSSLI